MKVLHVIHRFAKAARRGSEVYTYGLCRAFAGRHNVAVLCTASQIAAGRVETEVVDGVPTFVVGSADSWEEAKLRGQSRQAEGAFSRVLGEWRPDVVHFQHLLFHSLRLPTIAARAGVPSVFTLHDFWLLCPQIHLLDHRQQISWPITRRKCIVCCRADIRRGRSTRRLIEWGPAMVASEVARAWYLMRGRPRLVRTVFRDVGLFIAPSRDLRDRFVAEGLSPSKVFHCGHGINLDLRPATYVRDDVRVGGLRCGFIGTVAAHKGMDVLLEAFAGLDGASLSVYGAAASAYVSRPREDSIRFMGEISDAQKAEAFRAMDVLIVPSICIENFPLVMQEAFLFGVPVIASDIGGMTELVKDGENGLLFKAGDAADLRRKVEHLARNPGEVGRLAANVPHVKSSLEHAAEVDEFYERVLSRKRCSGRGGSSQT